MTELAAPRPGIATVHVPVRPGWHCSECPDSWPCEPRRAELLKEFALPHQRIALVQIMSGYFAEACADLRYAQAGTVHKRFFGWLPPWRNAQTGVAR
jgi:hypothetical protein